MHARRCRYAEDSDITKLVIDPLTWSPLHVSHVETWNPGTLYERREKREGRKEGGSPVRSALQDNTYRHSLGPRHTLALARLPQLTMRGKPMEKRGLWTTSNA